MKHTLAFLSGFFFLLLTASAQNLKSPDEFLGYKLGERFTPHHKIVQYFEYAALTAPAKMQLQTYGYTNEGRPLLLAVVGSAANMSNIEEIRKNNLRLTGLLADKTGTVDAPAITWLSYNVHGNEASSSEVSMKTLYELLNNNNAQAQTWLKNTVVIIDPCLNPDGRDRYVIWYNQMMGAEYNASTLAREHSEPWPGGRVNHYYFDLNRDWAWQTQVESQQRLVKYNEWMPQVHVDFHEQSPYSPYYFAPAAEPVHESVTDWQRRFQVTIGKNHAKYFDANGWLYFTKQYFDLFYPSYGDTYPMFNGSIGMTYEQAGHGSAGLAIALGESDTLKLTDRIAHHFTTSMSTLEMVAANNAPLMKEFKKYFDAGNNGMLGDYKTYVFSAADENKTASLIKLFKKNKIAYGYAVKDATTKGFNYFTGKEETVNVKENDLVVSSTQPKAALVKVLFEPMSRLSDSATYDITAWSLPYVYGMQAWALKEKLVGKENIVAAVKAPIPFDAYGYLVNYQSFSDAKLLAAMLKAGIKVRFAEKDFVYNGITYKKGTLVVLGKQNASKIPDFVKLAGRFNNNVTAIASGFMESGFDFGSDKLHQLKAPVVGMLTGSETSENASGEVWYFFDKELEYPITLINADELRINRLKDVDVLILPNGNYKMFGDKDAVAQLKSWVNQGGKIIALENAATALAAVDSDMKIKKEDDDKEPASGDKYADLKRFEDREKNDLKNNVPGAIYKVELDNSHPLAFGYPGYFFSLKMNTDLFEFGKNTWNVGVIKKDKQVAGFVGSAARQKLVDGTVIAVSPTGRGSIVYFADDLLFRNFWENGKLMFSNGVFLVGQ